MSGRPSLMKSELKDDIVKCQWTELSVWSFVFILDSVLRASEKMKALLYDCSI